ncbi:MAG: glycosyltransferase [Acetobacteraceae bacterium]|nr:glycosyltransferase [Acetobacteraceae bacterium]
MTETVSGSAPITVVGHPFAPIGMGEVLRSVVRSLRAAHVPVVVLDVFGSTNADPGLRAEFEPILAERVGAGASIFCINGDEIEPILAHLGARAGCGRRIVCPMWELSQYPDAWARHLERFDEVWAGSAFIRDALGASVRVPVQHLPLAVQPSPPPPLGRRAFGIPEAAFAFLTFFDLTSYIERKNPHAALEAFRRALASRPDLELCFVAKMNSGSARADDRERFLEYARSIGDRLVLLDRTMPDAEVKALHLCSDAFVSLHRSEGYGLGLAEAMFFGRPAIGTAYGGNVDFMTPDTSILLDHTLVPVAEGAYPHGAGQVWAEADVEQAAASMVRLADNPVAGRDLGASASRRMRTYFSHRAAGLRYAAQIAATRDEPAVRQAGALVSGASRADRERSFVYAHSRLAVAAAEIVAARHGNIEDVLAPLRGMSLDEFGSLLIGMPDMEFPGLSRVLPAMADAEIQRDWTGNAGIPLLRQTLGFVRSVALRSAEITGKPLTGRRILDFGCGYGRILRLMYYFTPPDRTFGVDPWDRSIEICTAARLPSHLAVSDYLPRSLPVGDRRFGLIYAFSVLTHTSERATRQALSVLRHYVEPDGLLALTIRPREYWEQLADFGRAVDARRMLADHDAKGFAFAPHDRPAIEGDVTYGDTSITLDWLVANAAGWRVAGYDHSLEDPLQVIAYLTPASAVSAKP